MSPQCFLPSFKSFGFKRRSEIRIFKTATMAAILDFRSADFSYILSTSHPDAFYQGWSQLAFGFGEEAKNNFFKMAKMAAILELRSARY